MRWEVCRWRNVKPSNERADGIFSRDRISQHAFMLTKARSRGTFRATIAAQHFDGPREPEHMLLAMVGQCLIGPSFEHPRRHPDTHPLRAPAESRRRLIPARSCANITPSGSRHAAISRPHNVPPYPVSMPELTEQPLPGLHWPDWNSNWPDPGRSIRRGAVGRVLTKRAVSSFEVDVLLRRYTRIPKTNLMGAHFRCQPGDRIGPGTTVKFRRSEGQPHL